LSIFITFEGGEGSGKSTQAEALAQRLRSAGIPVLLTHEPGGTPMGEQIKEWLKDREGKGEADLDPQTELLLFNAARAQLVSKVIKPALESDTVVICDRFYHSTIAYQGYGRSLDLELVKSVIDLATGGLKPTLIILMDIDVQKGLARKELLDRFEREDIEFHQRVRQSYLGMAHKDPQRWLVVNAALDQQDVEHLIWDWVGQLLPAMRRLGQKRAEDGVEPATPPESATQAVETEAVSPSGETAIPQLYAAASPDPIVETPATDATPPQEQGAGEAAGCDEEAVSSPPKQAAGEATPRPEVIHLEFPIPAAEEGKGKKKAKPPKKKASAKPKKDTGKKVAKKKEK